MNICYVPSFLLAANQVDNKAHVPYGWIIGGLGIGLALIIFSIILCVSLRSSNCFSDARRSHAKDTEGKIFHKFHILRNSSFCCGSGRYACDKPLDQKQTDGESSNHQISIPKVPSNLPTHQTFMPNCFFSHFQFDCTDIASYLNA